MKKQDYKHHKMYYAPHHFVFLPIAGLLAGSGLWMSFTDKQNSLVWALFSITVFLILYLAIMLRQHYALGNQDRIVRLEFRLRYYEVYKEPAEKIEQQLSFAQIAALRFSGNDEFSGLLERILKENLDSDQIKKAISHWKADTMRL